MNRNQNGFTTHMKLDSEGTATFKWSCSAVQVLSPEGKKLLDAKCLHSEITGMLDSVLLPHVEDAVIYMEGILQQPITVV